MKKKSAILLVVVAAIVVFAIGGTLAWLKDSTDPITNTFTTSNIDITLTETTGETYQMVPGYTLDKDPVVTVEANSEKAYVFVKLEKKNSFDDYMTYSMADGWTQLTDDDGNAIAGVFYREVESATKDQKFVVIADNEVTVKNTVTNEMMENLTAATYPTLTVTAYASQYYESDGQAFSAYEAWGNL